MRIPVLTQKHQVLSRRVASLPMELDTWLERAETGNVLEKNFSQIEALDHFMRASCRLIEDDFNSLDPAGDTDVFLDRALHLTEALVKSQFIWDFFRDRLELRFVPQFYRPLRMADLISNDCYTTITDRAEALRIIPGQGFREYPLIGLMTHHSPLTWPRGCRPWGLQNPHLPVPVIDLPWDHLTNPWELLTIAHEVGHDVDEDLGQLTRALQPVIANRLKAIGTPPYRVVQWQVWTGEILADLVGTLLVGPAFVQALTGLLTLPRRHVRSVDPTDPHPPHYLRLFVSVAMIRRLRLPKSADALEADWKALYGEPGNDFGPYLPEVELIISTILDTPIAALRDLDGNLHSLGELVAFAPEDQERIQEASARLVTGALPGEISVRYVVSASQLAFERMAQTCDAAKLAALAERTRDSAFELSPPGQLPARLTSRRTRRHLENLAREYLNRPMDDIGVDWPIIKEGR